MLVSFLSKNNKHTHVRTVTQLNSRILYFSWRKNSWTDFDEIWHKNRWVSGTKFSKQNKKNIKSIYRICICKKIGMLLVFLLCLYAYFLLCLASMPKTAKNYGCPKFCKGVNFYVVNSHKQMFLLYFAWYLNCMLLRSVSNKI